MNIKELEHLYKSPLSSTETSPLILKLIAVHRIASKLVNKTSGWRQNFGHKLPEDWMSWMEDLEKAISEVSDV